MEHTKAPWYTKPLGGDHGQHIVYSENSGASVAVVYNDNGDAALITAAPELLAALEKAARTLAVLKTFCNVPLTVVRAAETEHAIDAAIAKAKGEQS